MTASLIPPVGGGGRGGSVPSAAGAYGVVTIRSEGMNERMNHVPLVPEQQFDGVPSVLLAHGVFILSTERRQAVATLCAAALVTASELHDLLLFIADSEPVPATARRYMAAIVGDGIKLRESIDGMRSFRRGQASMTRAEVPVAVVPAGPSHVPNMPRGSLACVCGACVAARSAVATDSQPSSDRACGMVRCRVDGDRRTVAEVAAEMVMAEADVAAMLERGRALADPPPPLGKGRKQLDRDEKFERERVREFADAPRAERLRLLRGIA